MPRSIGHDDVEKLLADGATVAEVLPAEEYRWAHIRGAVHLPLKRWDPDEVRARFDPSTPIVLYCNDFL